MLKVVPVVLAGGVGSRLWPLSREAMPKQFLALDGDKTMLQNTCQRIQKALPGAQEIFVVTNHEYRFVAAEQMLEMGIASSIILESVSCNTAPAIATAALRATQLYDDAILFILPADHVIKNESALSDKFSLAIELAQQGYLTTFGNVPTFPATGYGYIKKGKTLISADSYQINSFHEKPDLNTATQFVNSPDYLWNSGMFAFKASTYLSELKNQSGDIFNACESAVTNGQKDLDFFRLNEESMKSCQNISIDHLIMENTKHGAVIPIDVGWSDVGSWNILSDISDKDKSGNTLIGDAIQVNSKNSYIRSENRLLTTIGIEDCIVLETADAVLVAQKQSLDNIKELLSQLKKTSRNEVKFSQQVYRPWGWYKTLLQSTCYKVKEIMVEPGASLSLQSHKQRSEHWVVVKGHATITKGEEKLVLETGMSTFIPVETKHRLSNQHKDALFLIEVQCGDYLEEDDIVRYADDYGRDN